MTGLGRALPDGLRLHGARELFGIPGNFVLPLFTLSRRRSALRQWVGSN